ncbi:hypothetical protein LPJ64_005154 [Coemansia asiatica]|uniref:Transmembrane protein n=1 Tax=Coemansia asiatica TaxID=1052880 RepID=A0A9W7XHK4_9FUNG|nr:hypothetical protein LPJ64_005154 [Coemansia asiatica]
MPHPFNVISNQSLKSNLSLHERQALESARTRFRLYGLIGGTAGAGLGYYLTRRNKSLAMRALMVFFNGAFLSSVFSGYASVTSLRQLSDPQRYPHINAAMQDIRNEILRSRGVDPAHPERSRAGTIPHKPDFEHLPPSTVGDERVGEAEGQDSAYSGFASQSDEIGSRYQQSGQEFGNPALQTYGSNGSNELNNNGQLAAWDRIRKSSNEPASAWDRVRSQSIGQQQQQQQQQGQRRQPAENTARQLDDAWGRLGQENDLGDSSSPSFGNSALSSDDFPRSREDFEPQSQQSSSSGRYSGGTAFSA